MRGAGLVIVVEVVGLKKVRVEDEKKGRLKRLLLLWRACPSSWGTRVRDREAIVVLVWWSDVWEAALYGREVHRETNGTDTFGIKICGGKYKGVFTVRDYIRA